MYLLNRLLIILTIFFWSCQAHEEHNHQHEGEEGHAHEEHDPQLEDEEDHAHEEHEANDSHESIAESSHDHEEADHQDQEGHDEEANTDIEENEYGILELRPDTFYRIIHVSGEIIPAQGEEYLITANHTGLVLFNDRKLFEGSFIKKNEVLLTLSTDELIHDNIDAGYIESKNNFENAHRDYLRAQELNKDKITSDKTFQDAKAKYLSAKKQFELIQKHYTEEGKQVDAHQEGYIKEIYVREGEYVNAGSPLIKLTRTKRLMLRADVPQQYFNILPQVSSATFKTPYSNKIYSSLDLNGSIVSYGKTTSSNSLFTPLYLEVDNRGNLLAGSYVELYLKTSQKPGSMLIPKSAILEEMGKYYVYVSHGEHFDKAYITTGGTDGRVVEVLDGLNFGDHVATKNPYRIKLASLSSELPAHSHNH